MQILSRRSGESLYIDIAESVDPSTPVGELFADGPIEIEVVQVGKQVKLAIDAAPVLARALEVGNHVDSEPGTTQDWWVRLAAFDRATVLLVGAAGAVMIAALAWWAGAGRPPGGYTPPLATREVPPAVSQAATPRIELDGAEPPAVKAPTREVPATEPPPVAEMAVTEIAPEPAVPERPAQQQLSAEVTVEQPAGMHADRTPLFEPAAQKSARTEQRSSDTRRVAHADQGAAERGKVAFSVVTTTVTQDPAPTPQSASLAPAPLPEMNSKMRVATDTAVHREAWLLDQPPDRYTLQLFGVRRESAVLRFLRTQRLEGPVAYYRTDYKGDDWFVLLYGDYSSESRAREAFAQLPKAARSGAPYPRSMGSVQASINGAADSH